MRLPPLIAFTLFAHVLQISAQSAAPIAVNVFLEQHCTKCHDAENKKGNLDLSTLSYELNSPEVFRAWQDIFDRVVDGEMPPKKRTQPKTDEKIQFLGSLGGDLKEANLAEESARGRVQARHLTRSEFERSIQDLLGVYLPLQRKLPEDPLTDGFTTVARGQQISPNQLETYLSVIDSALATAFHQTLTPSVPWKKNFLWEELAHTDKNNDRGPEGRPAKQDVVAWSSPIQFYGRMPATKVPESGWYRVRFKACAVNPPKGQRLCASVFSGHCASSDPVLNWVGSIEATTQEADYEFFAWMEARHILEVRPGDATLKRVTGHKAKTNADNYETLDGLDYPGIAIRTIEVEHVYPGFSREDAHKSLFGALRLEPSGVSSGGDGQGKSKKEKGGAKEAGATPESLRVVSENPQADLKQLIHVFASRAFRRPVTAAEIQEYVGLAHTELAGGAEFSKALRAGYRAILTSPRFYYLEEAPGVLDNHALAARLSYFLWSSTPDSELRALADAGKLGNLGVLHAQVDRLLNHGNSGRFVRNFTDQWLKLGEIDATDPDHKLYYEFDECLKNAMLEETRAYFRDMLDRDVSVKNIVDSNYSFVNSRLAKHYALPSPPAAGFQRVSVSPEQHRGGIITQASILKVTANGTTTSPVVRGVWMMDRILGQTVPPPPPNVPAVEPDIRGAHTIRQQLDKHRTQEACAACHTKIDPPGFALENYDVIGGWRVNYRAANEKGDLKEGLKVDPSYKMADGANFSDIRGFKQLLLARPDQLARNLTRQLVTYSTGAPPSFTDRETIESIVSAAKTKDYGARTLIHLIVQSPMFLNK